MYRSLLCLCLQQFGTLAATALPVTRATATSRPLVGVVRLPLRLLVLGVLLGRVAGAQQTAEEALPAVEERSLERQEETHEPETTEPEPEPESEPPSEPAALGQEGSHAPETTGHEHSAATPLANQCSKTTLRAENARRLEIELEDTKAALGLCLEDDNPLLSIRSFRPWEEAGGRGWDWIMIDSLEWLKGTIVQARDGEIVFDSDEFGEVTFESEDVIVLYSPHQYDYITVDKDVHETNYISVPVGREKQENGFLLRPRVFLDWEIIRDVNLELDWSTSLVATYIEHSFHHAEARLSIEVTDVFDLDWGAIFDRQESPQTTDEGETPVRNDLAMTLGVGIKLD